MRHSLLSPIIQPEGSAAHSRGIQFAWRRTAFHRLRLAYYGPINKTRVPFNALTSGIIPGFIKKVKRRDGKSTAWIWPGAFRAAADSFYNLPQILRRKKSQPLRMERL